MWNYNSGYLFFPSHKRPSSQTVSKTDSILLWHLPAVSSSLMTLQLYFSGHKYRLDSAPPPVSWFISWGRSTLPWPARLTWEVGPCWGLSSIDSRNSWTQLFICPRVETEPLRLRAQSQRTRRYWRHRRSSWFFHLRSTKIFPGLGGIRNVSVIWDASLCYQ